MLRQLAAIVPEVTNLPGDLRQVRLFRSNSLSSDRSYRSRQQPAAALRGGALRAAAGRPCLCTFGASEGSSSRRLFRVGEQVVLFRSRKQPAAALRGRTSCGGRSALPLHLWCFEGVHHGGCSGSESRLFYFAHASSLRLRSAGAHFVRRPVGLASAPSVLRRSSSRRLLRVGERVVLFRSRQQPAAALRGGALHAARSRACLGTYVPRRSSSRRLLRVGERVVLFRSRQQPSAALRGGALRAARSRACLGTSCLGGIHHEG